MLTLSLTPVGKLFFASVIAWVVHDTKLNWKLRGEPDKVRTLANAIVNSKRFQAEINKPGASVDSVIAKLNLKNMSAQQFEQLTGHRFPL